MLAFCTADNFARTIPAMQANGSKEDIQRLLSFTRETKGTRDNSRLCYDMKTSGFCRHGNACKFLHSDEHAYSPLTYTNRIWSNSQVSSSLLYQFWKHAVLEKLSAWQGNCYLKIRFDVWKMGHSDPSNNAAPKILNPRSLEAFFWVCTAGLSSRTLLD